MIKFLEIFTHILKDILNSNIDFLHYSFVDISYNLLDHFELLEKFSSGLKYILWEYILFTINPKVWETFLCWIKDFGQVA